MCYLRLFIVVLQELNCLLHVYHDYCGVSIVYIMLRLDWLLCE